MKTFEFKSEKNFGRAYDAICEDRRNLHYCSYGYLAITTFDETATEFLKDFCKQRRIAIKEV